MNSHRFPGKAMERLAGRPLLQLLLQRVRRATAIDRLVVATSTGQGDNAIQDLCEPMGVTCVRGSEDDVLGRFMQVLDAHPAEAVIRICADNPLTDPELLDDLADHFHRGQFDYAYNNLPECGYPDGVGAEIISGPLLRQIALEAHEGPDREHVTLFVKRHRKQFRTMALQAPTTLGRPDIRLDVDYPEDFRCMQSLCAVLPSRQAPYWSTADIIAAVDGHPRILQLRHSAAA